MQNAKLYAHDCRRLPAIGSISVLLRVVVAALLLPVAPAIAQAPALASAEALQWPVWVERNGSRRPLAAGEMLRNSDRLATGTGGRALLRLADGSGVKLGENAELAVAGLGQRPGSVLTAALAVTRGAFRFTTGLFSSALTRREVSVRVDTITAGIRGTDVWGKSDSARDLVCLLEGRISVAHAQAAPQIMDQALSFYVAPKGQAPGPVAMVDAAQVARWAAETEIEAGKGVGRAGGRWQVLLPALDSQSAALASVDALRDLGYPVSLRSMRAGDGFRYELRIRHLTSRDDAATVAARLTDRLGLTGTKIRQ